MQAAYVRGARGRRMRPVLIAGNLVAASLSARTDSQLPQATVELTHSRAPLLAEPLARRGDRMGDRADRHRAARSAALSAALFGARRAAGGDRGGAVGQRLGRGAGPLRTAAARRTGLRPRPRELRGQRLAPTIWSRSARARAGRSAPPRPSPMRASCCRCRASSAKAGRRAGPRSPQGLDLTGHFLMRDVLTQKSARPGRGEVAAGRSPAPGRRARLARRLFAARAVA